jgi:hypothetical protein
MAKPHLPPPVKYFVAVLYAEPAALSLAYEKLSQRYGKIDYQSKDYPFDQTDYYQKEMGHHLRRRLVTFEQLRSPAELVETKLKCNAIEEEMQIGGKRQVNLDMGYLDHNKIILASAKGLSQKIYLHQGIYADLVARYSHGRYQPFEWTFPDFKDGRYDVDLAVIRQRYLDELKRMRE